MNIWDHWNSAFGRCFLFSAFIYSKSIKSQIGPICIFFYISKYIFDFYSNVKIPLYICANHHCVLYSPKTWQMSSNRDKNFIAEPMRLDEITEILKISFWLHHRKKTKCWSIETGRQLWVSVRDQENSAFQRCFLFSSLKYLKNLLPNW